MKKNIVVCGDLVWDTHIARLPWSGKGYSQPHEQTHLKNHYGGAWYLRDVIAGAAKVAGLKVKVTAPERARHEEIKKIRGPGGTAKGFTVWEWFKEEKSGTWRMKEFLGCQSAKWEKEKTKKDAENKSAVTSKSAAQYLPCRTPRLRAFSCHGNVRHDSCEDAAGLPGVRR